jgi:hypothetical protein
VVVGIVVAAVVVDIAAASATVAGRTDVVLEGALDTGAVVDAVGKPDTVAVVTVVVAAGIGRR